MSETEDVVTEDDVQEDGKVKAGVMSQLQSVAKRESPEIFEHFEDTCNRLGVTPKILLADMLVNAINDEGYAEQIENTDISLRKVKMNNIRLDDARFIRELQSEFMPEKTEDDPIDKLIERNIEGATQTPIARMSSDDGGGGREKQLEREVQQLRNELQRMRGDGEPQTAEPHQRRDSAEHEEEVDNLFSDGDGQDDDIDAGVEEQDSEETGEVETEEEDKTMNDETPTEEEVEEAKENIREEEKMAEQWRQESGEPDEEGSEWEEVEEEDDSE